MVWRFWLVGDWIYGREEGMVLGGGGLQLHGYVALWVGRERYSCTLE